MKANLLDLDAAALAAFFAEQGEKPFRARQVLRWVHQSGESDFERMSDLAKALRAKLAASARVEAPRVVGDSTAADGTRKWLLKVDGANAVDAVFIPETGRGTLCVSSQAGCVLDCAFCSTGKQGFNRNLSTAEIVGQLWLANRLLEGERPVTNVVLMGMGEPLLNFDAVVAATEIMMDDLAFGISKRRVTVSTAGVVPAIYELAKTSDVSLAISLHAPNDALRDRLVPLNRKYPIAELLAACRHYVQGLGERRSLTMEYTLIKGVNDEIAQARELAALLADVRCKINLIPFNPFPASGFERPEQESVRRFQTCLMNMGYATMLRTTRGEDIDAACGQLVGRVEDRTRRRARYLARVRAEAVASGGTTPGEPPAIATVDEEIA